MSEIVQIDESGRIKIPDEFIKVLGLEKDIRIEKKKFCLIITPIKKKHGLIVNKIASMNLPVSDWNEMEQEIEQGAI